MKTKEYCRAVKTKLGISSDYALAKALNVTKQSVSHYVNGHRTFDVTMAVKVAEILELDPLKVIAETELERGGDPDLWKRIARQAAALFGVGLGVALLAHFARSSGADPQQALALLSVSAVPFEGLRIMLSQGGRGPGAASALWQAAEHLQREKPGIQRVTGQ